MRPRVVLSRSTASPAWPSEVGGRPGLNTLDPQAHRIRHALPAARWPTAEEAARARWFSPIQIGRSLTAAERTWVPAMVPWRATADGFVTPEVLEWYAR